MSHVTAPTDPDLLARGYAHAEEITRRHGRTYYWGARLLTPAQRRDVHAVYALARVADDLVDEPDAPYEGTATPPDGTPAQRLAWSADTFRQAVAAGTSDDPLMAAAVATVARRDIDPGCFDRFFAAMALDLTRTSWDSWEQLRDEYMDGSAAVIGEMMVPVLEPTSPAATAPARALGLAFQLTNFIRDVGEDLDRGRVYLPADDLARHGVDPWARTVTPQWRAFLGEQITRNRRLYDEAEAGIPLLPPASARCVATALRMYRRILTEVEAADYDVFTARRRVPGVHKAAVVADVLVRGPRAGLASLPPERIGDRVPLSVLPQPQLPHAGTWREAAPARIAASLDLAQTMDPGGWYVVGATRDVRQGVSTTRQVAGREVVLWRTDAGRLVAGPGACPHLGALLDDCPVSGDRLLCRWHGLPLPAEGNSAWQPYAAHDDGVLVWVRLDTPGEVPTARPALPRRPDEAASIAAVVAHPARCEPRDIIANRLDPWHGAWFHPYAFSHLRVDEQASTPDRLVTHVAFRLGRRLAVPVVAEFTCPDARSIVMTIVEGEGRGSVVETHATPMGVDREGHPVTMLVEATIAHSPRTGFAAARRVAPLLRPAMARTASRLWVDDLDYAERLYQVRRRAGGR